MTDILLFIRDGWRNLWRQKIIWLFSAPRLLYEVFGVIHIKNYSALFELFLYLLFLFLLWNSLIGVPYIAYSSATDKAVDLGDTLYTISKFAARTLACACLVILIVAPFIILVAALTLDRATQPPHFSSQAILLLLPLSIFAALLDFTLFGFFAHDWGVRQSLKNAWTLFRTHFGVLAMSGIMIAILWRIYSAASGALTVLIQSNFDLTSVSRLDFIDPLASLRNNLLYVLLSGIGQIVLTAFSSSIFAFAYLKYSQSNTR